MTTETPRQIDTQLAENYNATLKAQAQLERFESSLKSTAGATYYYRGRQRVTDMTVEEARERVETELAKHTGDDYGYARLGAPCSPSSSTGNARRALEGIDAQEAELAELANARFALEARYTGWSRFFLVTSSTGHIHSSMHCSTCRPTTTYGWLPELSGQSEAQAVEAHGPALCSVCFPSAPVEWTGAKLTKAQAAKVAA